MINIIFIGKRSSQNKINDYFIKSNQSIFTKNNINTHGIFYEYKKFKLCLDKIGNSKIYLFNIHPILNTNINKNIKKLEDLFISKNDQSNIIHPVSLIKIIENKVITNEFLTKNNIKCPQIINNFTNPNDIIFQNEIIGTQTKSFIIKYSDHINLDNTKYNTKYINTLYKHKQNYYYCSIRLMCVGGDLIQILLRFRDVKEKNSNVHSKNTPLISSLINSYYEEIILPNYGHLKLLSQQIGQLFGLGFYMHDIGFSNEDKKFYVFESGMKMSDMRYFEHIKPIQKHLKYFNSPDQFHKKQVTSFISQI